MRNNLLLELVLYSEAYTSSLCSKSYLCQALKGGYVLSAPTREWCWFQRWGDEGADLGLFCSRTERVPGPHGGDALDRTLRSAGLPMLYRLMCGYMKLIPIGKHTYRPEYLAISL